MKITKRQLKTIIETELLEGGIGGTIASAVLFLPAILEKIGKIMERLGKRFDREKLELRGEKLEHFAHNLHERYRRPIKKTIQFASKQELTEEQLEKYTDIFFGILIAGMMIYTGVQIKKEVAHLQKHFELATLGLALLETALGTIEIGEEFDIIGSLLDRRKQDAISDAIDDHVASKSIHESALSESIFDMFIPGAGRARDMSRLRQSLEDLNQPQEDVKRSKEINETFLSRLVKEELEKIGFYKKYSYGLDDIPNQTKAHDDIIGHT